LYLRVVDAVRASYGVEDVFFAMTQLAQTTMRSELGKITLDKTFAERETLNTNIVRSINQAAEAWGIQCLRYEIRDILPPTSVKLAMDMQAEAERRKRVSILDSEGRRQSQINDAEGARQAAILKAQGEAEAVLIRAGATAKGLKTVAEAVQTPGGATAMSLSVAEQYMSAFSKLAKQSTTLMLPTNVSDPSSFIAQALTIFNRLSPDSARRPAVLAPSEPQGAEPTPDAGDKTQPRDDGMLVDDMRK